MATLMENLIDTLKKECDVYEKLLLLSRQKTPVIIAGDLDKLNKITDEEQEHAGTLQNLENKRIEVTTDMANVLNKDVASLKLKNLIEDLEKSSGGKSRDARELAEIHDRLRGLVYGLKQVNEQNQELLKSSLEVVQFEMQMIQSMKTAPETANYSKGAHNTGDTMGISRRGFDAKQ